MTEGTKTLLYAGAALVLIGAAVLFNPRQEPLQLNETVGKVLFPKFDDPAKAASLEFVRYDSKEDRYDQFKVARDKSAADAWTIPSHAGYPADAKDRMKDAALMLVDLKVLGVASEVKGDHKLFGVIAPDKEKLERGAEGVGDLLTFEDRKGQPLASLVIGKKVRGAEGQRFVRIPSQDVVYTVKIDPDKLTTKFQEWIEKDLLKLNAWDVENVRIRNYAVARALNAVSLDQRFEIAAKQDNNEWKLQELINYRDNEPLPGALAEGEELNKDKLNDLKTAVDDLAIVDVRRKPQGLGADLRAGDDFMKNQEAQEDLLKRGFYPVRVAGGPLELLCANGEVHVGMKDGVEYVLRFGEIAPAAPGETSEGQNRYLFVTTRVDMSKFPEPELPALPEPPAGAKDAKPEAKPETKPEGKAEDKPAGKPEAKKDAVPGEKPAPPEPAKDAAGTTQAKPTAAAAEKTETAQDPASESKPETAPPADAAPKADTKPAEAKPAEAKPAEAKPAAEKQGPEAGQPEVKPEAKPETKPEAQPAGEAKKPETAKEAAESDVAKERERLLKEYQKKVDERNEKIKKARERVAELNVRFADWYYVVPDKEYKKIHLERSDLIKLSDKAKEEATTVDGFRTLQKEGLTK